MNRVFPRILIVDDDVTFNYTISRIFEMWKWDSRRAHNVAEAKRILSGGEKFDLAMIDLMLPDGDGSELITCTKSVCKCAKVVVVTGKMDVDNAEAMKPDLVLKKPFYFEPLRDMASRIWDDFFMKRMGVGVAGVVPGVSVGSGSS
jgi:DNA-binding NtrC family response regulator